MFCSNCGRSAAGNFCSGCGAPLAARPQTPAADWRQEARYEALLAHPEVKARLVRAAAAAGGGLTGEQVLDLFDKVAEPVIPLKALAAFAQPLYAKLGVRTGKSRAERVPALPGEVLAAVLCSLARNGQAVKAADQRRDGCELVARLPSDVRALEGELVVDVRRAAGGSLVEAETRIAGQFFDWGKSARCLERLFADVAHEVRDGRRAG